MIIFNLFAVPILLLVGAIGAGLIWLLPAVFGGPYEEITYSVLAIGIGGLFELIGLKGRLFFLPIWLIGGAVLSYQLWTLFGMLGLAAGVGLMGLLVVAFIATIVWALWAADKEMPQKLEEARQLLGQGKVILAKPVLADAWVLPPMGSLKAARLRHLREVLRLITEHHEGLAIRGEGPALVRGAERVLDRALNENREYGFFSEEAQLLGEIEWMLRDAEKWTLKDHHREALAKL